jgi:Protein of unknown function (DUF2281)
MSEENITRRDFMRLPMEERRRILARQADAMVEHYQQDGEWREWINSDIGKVSGKEAEQQPRQRRQAGSAKGQIWMAPDFDEPLEDFQEYM